MNQTFDGIYILVIGLFMAIFYKTSAHHAAKFYKRFHIPHPSDNTGRIFFLLGGITSAILGLLVLFRIIEFG